VTKLDTHKQDDISNTETNANVERLKEEDAARETVLEHQMGTILRTPTTMMF
jgi:hypothetical protein